MFLFTSIFIFIFGLIIGSFLNVVILRLHDGESAAAGRSKCPDCGHVLAWTDLFPVFSFLFLGRRCRYCGSKISWQYPLVELATGGLFVIAYYFNPDWTLASGLVLLRNLIVIAALIAVFVYDLRWLIIPDQIALPALLIVIALNFFIGMSLANLATGVVVGLGFFGLQYALSRGTWIGGGDLRLGALMGALLGWPVILVALFMSYIIGAIVALVLLAQKKVTAKSQVPFGVFLAPAAIVAMFWGQWILAWYLGRLN